MAITRDGDLTAGEDATSRIIRQLANARVRPIGHRPDATRVHGDDTSVVVGQVVEFTRGSEGQRAARVYRDITRVALASGDRDVAAREGQATPRARTREDYRARVDGQGTGVGIRAREGLRARTDLGDAQGEGRSFGQRAGEDTIGVVRTDVQVAGDGDRVDQTSTGEATNDFGAGGHGQVRTGGDIHIGVVGDTVHEAGRRGADLHDTRTRERHVTREGVRADEADDRTTRTDEVHVARARDTTEVGAVGGVGVESDVTRQDHVIEAEDTRAGDVGSGTEGCCTRAIRRDDDLIHQVSARGWSGDVEVERSVTCAGVGVAEGDRARAQRSNVTDVDLTVADDRTTREGVGDGASHGQDTRARLDDRAEARQNVGGRVSQRDINRAVIDRDEGRRDRAGEGDVIMGQGGGVIDGDDVTIDELIGQRGRGVREVQRIRTCAPGVAGRARPSQRAVAQLQVNCIARDREGRGLTVATGAGEDEVGSRGVRGSEGQDREGVRIGRTVQQVHRDRPVDGEGTERGEAGSGERVGLEGRVVVERDRLRRAETDQVSACNDREVRVIDRAREVQGTDRDRGRTRVGVRAGENRRSRAQLIDTRVTRDGRVDVLRTRRRQGQRAAAIDGEGTAARDIILDRKATGRVDRVERSARAGDVDDRRESDGAVRDQVTNRTAREVECPRGEVTGDDTCDRVEGQNTTAQVVRARSRVIDRGGRVIDDDPRRGDRAAGLVERADAVTTDVDTTVHVGIEGRRIRSRARSRVDHGDGAAAEVVDRCFRRVAANDNLIQDRDSTARLVNRATHVGGRRAGVTDIQEAGANRGTRVNIQDGASHAVRDADITAERVDRVEEVNGATI